MYRRDTSTKTIHQIRDVSPQKWSFFRLVHAWTSPSSSPRTPGQWILSSRRIICTVVLDISPHASLVEAHERRKWVLLSALNAIHQRYIIHDDTSKSWCIGAIHQRYITLTSPQGGSTIHQIIDVSRAIHQTSNDTSIHQRYIKNDVSPPLCHAFYLQAQVQNIISGNAHSWRP